MGGCVSGWVGSLVEGWVNRWLTLMMYVADHADKSKHTKALGVLLGKTRLRELHSEEIRTLVVLKNGALTPIKYAIKFRRR